MLWNTKQLRLSSGTEIAGTGVAEIFPGEVIDIVSYFERIVIRESAWHVDSCCSTTLSCSFCQTQSLVLLSSPIRYRVIDKEQLKSLRVKLW